MYRVWTKRQQEANNGWMLLRNRAIVLGWDLVLFRNKVVTVASGFSR